MISELDVGDLFFGKLTTADFNALTSISAKCSQKNSAPVAKCGENIVFCRKQNF